MLALHVADDSRPSESLFPFLITLFFVVEGPCHSYATGKHGPDKTNQDGQICHRWRKTADQ